MGSSVTSRAAALALLVVVAGLRPPGAAAIVSVDSESRIDKTRFRFVGTKTFSEKALRERLSFSEEAPSGLRGVASSLPFVPNPPHAALDPIGLQENVARLRLFYHDSGFPRAAVRYDVRPAGEKNVFDVTFEIDEGAPLVVRSITFVDSAGAPFAPPPHDREAFEKAQREAGRLSGGRFTAATTKAIEDRTRAWWRERGYPFVHVAAAVSVDSSRSQCDIAVATAPGQPSRIGEISVEGNVLISDEVILRELPFRSGDAYSSRLLDEGKRAVQGLEIVRTAKVDALQGSPVDSGVAIHVQVREDTPRLVSGEAGYDTDSGIVGQLRWSHRNFGGGARSLGVNALAETGKLAVDEDAETRYRGEITLRQPYVWNHRLSLLTGPFVEYGEDEFERSLEVGANAALIYELAPLRSVALKYEYARKHIYGYDPNGLASGDIDLLSLLVLNAQGVLDSLGGTLDRSDITLSATLGSIDDPTNPRRGFVFRPTARVTTPRGLNSTQSLRVNGTISGYHPMGRRVGFLARFSAGRLFPYGKSIPGPGEDGTTEFLRLHDDIFTAGGVDDVRGWGERLLGPKFPVIEFREEGDSLAPYTDGYDPLGGLARVAGSLEVRLPFPGLGETWGTHAFFDAGRVWTPDDRFRPEQTIDNDGDRLFFSTGGGIDFKTVVGAIRLTLGYKLNPSLFDVVDDGDALEAILGNRPVEDLPRDESRRFHLHLSLNTAF